MFLVSILETESRRQLAIKSRSSMKQIGKLIESRGVCAVWEAWREWMAAGGKHHVWGRLPFNPSRSRE